MRRAGDPMRHSVNEWLNLKVRGHQFCKYVIKMSVLSSDNVEPTLNRLCRCFHHPSFELFSLLILRTLRCNEGVGGQISAWHCKILIIQRLVVMIKEGIFRYRLKYTKFKQEENVYGYILECSMLVLFLWASGLFCKSHAPLNVTVSSVIIKCQFVQFIYLLLFYVRKANKCYYMYSYTSREK